MVIVLQIDHGHSNCDKVEKKKIMAQRTEEAVRSTMPAHPRRASVGGPLQSSQVTTAIAIALTITVAVTTRIALDPRP